MHPGSVLRQRLQQEKVLVMPGGGSPMEMKLIEQAGFDGAYLSGYATAATRFGLPDIGLMAFGEVESAVAACRRVTELPIVVDCDTGYGDIINVQHTVRAMARQGVAAVQIEDQAWPKRCGHLNDKIVEPIDVAVRKVRAAVAAAKGTETLIVARTDARGPLGLDEALNRCRLFHEAGADILFVDGPESMEDLERIGSELPGVLMANMSETGKTPLMPASQLQALGFKLVIFPSATVRLAVKIMGDFLGELRETGDSRPWISRMASLDETNLAMDMDKFRAFEADILAAGK